MIDDVENGTVGSSFDDFLKEQGTYEATVDQAVKRVLAFQQRRTARMHVQQVYLGASLIDICPRFYQYPAC